MPQQNEKQLGRLIQKYVDSTWGSNLPDQATALECRRQLSRNLRERIDVLGLDTEQLLQVSIEEVLNELVKLEAEAAHEDTQVVAAVITVRAKEEESFRRSYRSPSRLEEPSTKPPNRKRLRRPKGRYREHKRYRGSRST